MPVFLVVWQGVVVMMNTEVKMMVQRDDCRMLRKNVSVFYLVNSGRFPRTNSGMCSGCRIGSQLVRRGFFFRRMWQ